MGNGMLVVSGVVAMVEGLPVDVATGEIDRNVALAGLGLVGFGLACRWAFSVDK